MSRCMDFEEDLSAYVDGELSKGRLSEVEQHLGSCDRCRVDVEAYQTIDLGVGALDPPRRWSWQATWRAAAALLTAAGILIGVVMWLDPDRSIVAPESASVSSSRSLGVALEVTEQDRRIESSAHEIRALVLKVASLGNQEPELLKRLSALDKRLEAIAAEHRKLHREVLSQP